MGFGENLQKYRKQCNLNQNEVAEQLNVTRQTVSNWETNKSEPDVETMIKLSNLYHVSMEELVNAEKKEADNEFVSQETEDIIISPKEEKYKVEKILLCMIGMIISCQFPPIGVILNLFLLIFYKSQSKKENFFIKIIAIICLGYSLYGCYWMILPYITSGYGTIEKL